MLNEKQITESIDEQLKDIFCAITPICIVVDTSHSMTQAVNIVEDNEKSPSKMDRLNDGFKLFLHNVQNDVSLADSAMFSIITFGYEPTIIETCATADDIVDLQFSDSGEAGDTPKAVKEALELLDFQKAYIKSKNKKCNQPWLVIFSDGRATGRLDPVTRSRNEEDMKQRLSQVQKETKKREKDNKLNVISIYISGYCDKNTRNKESVKNFIEAKNQMKNFRNDKKLIILGQSQKQDEQVEFRTFFKYLAASVSAGTNATLYESLGMADVKDKTPKKLVKLQKVDPVRSELIKKRVQETLTRDREQIMAKTITVSIVFTSPLEKNDAFKVSYKPENGHQFKEQIFYGNDKNNDPTNRKFAVNYETYEDTEKMEVWITFIDKNKKTPIGDYLIKKVYNVNQNGKIFLTVFNDKSSLDTVTKTRIVDPYQLTPEQEAIELGTATIEYDIDLEQFENETYNQNPTAQNQQETNDYEADTDSFEDIINGNVSNADEEVDLADLLDDFFGN